ncbi:MAG: thioredoxin family protein [Deltaproteobacteria bacterium]|nr:thioredoxin family protein [Deltaproteobacteria bacterium]
MNRLLAFLAFVAFGAVALIGCNHHDATTTPAGPVPVKSLQLNAPGAMVDLEAALPAGYVTVVDFWGEHCGACVVVGGMLAVQVAHDPKVLIRKIDVGDGFTPIAEKHEVSALPHFKIYDYDKQLRATLIGNQCLDAPRIARAIAAERP